MLNCSRWTYVFTPILNKSQGDIRIQIRLRYGESGGFGLKLLDMSTYVSIHVNPSSITMPY